MNTEQQPLIGKPTPSNQCPECGSAGYKVSQPGARPVYRCFMCAKNFGGGALAQA